jgi:hypothetical protein
MAILTQWNCQDVDSLPADYTKIGSPTNVAGYVDNGDRKSVV